LVKTLKAGRFDQKTSADERRKMLEIMLKEEEVFIYFFNE
jgi:hypothetical protein